MSNSQVTSFENAIVRWERSLPSSRSAEAIALRGPRASTSSVTFILSAPVFVFTSAISESLTATKPTLPKSGTSGTPAYWSPVAFFAASVPESGRHLPGHDGGDLLRHALRVDQGAGYLRRPEGL